MQNICVCVCVCVYIYTHTHTHTHTHTYIYIHTHTHTHTHMWLRTHCTSKYMNYRCYRTTVQWNIFKQIGIGLKCWLDIYHLATGLAVTGRILDTGQNVYSLLLVTGRIRDTGQNVLYYSFAKWANTWYWTQRLESSFGNWANTWQWTERFILFLCQMGEYVTLDTRFIVFFFW